VAKPGRRYPPAVKRTHRLLERRGVRASLRQVERWRSRPETDDAGGLAPPEGTPEDVAIDHYGELAGLFRPGAGRGRQLSGDAAACHLAVRMFPNERQRLVVTRELHLVELGGLPRIGDDAARIAVAEQVAEREAGLDPSELPGWWRPWAESIADNLTAHPATLDEPERMMFGMLVHVVDAFLGGGIPTEPGYFHAAIGEDPPTTLSEGSSLAEDGTAARVAERPELSIVEQRETFHGTLARVAEGREGASLLVPEQCFPGADFDLRRIAAFVREQASLVRLAGSAAVLYPALVELRTKLDVKASDTHTKMAAAILGPAVTAMSADQPICTISGMHPVARGGPPVCIFCGASAEGQPALTI
jgi:hypothetical protein